MAILRSCAFLTIHQCGTRGLDLLLSCNQLITNKLYKHGNKQKHHMEN